jgi:transcriptional regulator with XRE-family HTH domain
VILLPETKGGRDAIIEFLKSEGISSRSLAKTFNVSHSYMQKVLSGENHGPSANKLILKIIDAFKI